MGVHRFCAVITGVVSDLSAMWVVSLGVGDVGRRLPPLGHLDLSLFHEIQHVRKLFAGFEHTFLKNVFM